MATRPCGLGPHRPAVAESATRCNGVEHAHMPKVLQAKPQRGCVLWLLRSLNGSSRVRLEDGIWLSGL